MEMTELTLKEVAAQAAGQAAAQAAQQVAAQVAQSISQSVSEAVSKVMQSQTQTTGQSTLTSELEAGETGFSERYQVEGGDRSGIMFGNHKRTYDEYQQESLESIKRNRSYVDKVLSDAATHDNRSRVIAEQALQNAVETANMIGKQAVAHRDIAIDNEWNPVESGSGNAITAKAVQLDDASVKAIAAALAAAFTQAVNTPK
jgi:hypothetical protein